MAASHSDSYQLSQDATFLGRVQAALITYFGVVTNEGWSVPFHRERTMYIASVMSSPTSLSNAVTLFTYIAAADTTALQDATQNGTIVLTSGNRASQQQLVTDAHIDNAIAAQFNQLVRVPQS